MCDEYFAVLAYDHRVMCGFYDHRPSNDSYVSADYWKRAFVPRENCSDSDYDPIRDGIPSYDIDDDDEIII